MPAAITDVKKDQWKMFRWQLNVPNPEKKSPDLLTIESCIGISWSLCCYYCLSAPAPKWDHAADNSNKHTTNARQYIKETVVSLYFSGFYMKVSKEKYWPKILILKIISELEIPKRLLIIFQKQHDITQIDVVLIFTFPFRHERSSTWSCRIYIHILYNSNMRP